MYDPEKSYIDIEMLKLYKKETLWYRLKKKIILYII